MASVVLVYELLIPHARTGSALSDTVYQRDSLLLAGDIADTLYGVKLALQTFKRKFRRVFYCPGNHDLWIRPGLNDDEEKKFPDSIAKFLAMHQLCDDLGCEMTPAEVCQELSDVGHLPSHY